MAEVKVNGLTIGTGMPKIAAPVVGTNKEEILAAVRQVCASPVDLLEWRVDFFDQLTSPTAVAELGLAIKRIIANRPLLITLRTSAEGGQQPISSESYQEVYQRVIEACAADIIDLEVARDQQLITALTEKAHENGIKVIMSSHDFTKTPAATELLARLGKMTALNADIVKFAVMPHNRDDLLTILTVNAHYAALPGSKSIIAIGMGRLGKIIRVGGKTFGSCISFGSVGQSSAPGQVEVHQLHEILTELHQ